MNPFAYQRATNTESAIHAGSASGASYLGGGTNLLDLMKDGVERPSALIDINHLALTQVTRTANGGVQIGALVRNSDLANHPLVRTHYPLLSQALLSGASPQLRNMATTGGNLMQRTRCYYFMDTAFPACNKRQPGSGCAAIHGFNRIHAILGASDQCIATNPSDMNVAMAALEATIHVKGPHGERSIPIADFHRLPGASPNIDTNLRAGELILSVELPAPRYASHSHYLKARDRNSYAFALVSVAAGLEIADGVVRHAALALGGVAHKPWRSTEAEQAIIGAAPGPENFRKAADLAVRGAKPYEHNAFKVELAKQCIVRALMVAAQGVNA
jgi:xanthine dehydrogenase YagS FAD-binding subunit